MCPFLHSVFPDCCAARQRENAGYLQQQLCLVCCTLIAPLFLRVGLLLSTFCVFRLLGGPPGRTDEARFPQQQFCHIDCPVVTSCSYASLYSVVSDCWAAHQAGQTKQGIYNMEPEGSVLPFLAYCDEDGWNVIQRRFGGEAEEALGFFRLVAR